MTTTTVSDQPQFVNTFFVDKCDGIVYGHHMTFRNNMKQLRSELGYTQTQMAKLIGCSLSMYQKAEIGLRMWSAEYNGVLEAAFKKPYREIYPGVYEGVTLGTTDGRVVHGRRLGKVTASRVVDIMPSEKTGKYLASRDEYMGELIAERLSGQPMPSFQTPAMAWGVAQEGLAREAYAKARRLPVVETGFVEHMFIKNFGASPDGLVGEDGMVEIKCPHTKKHLETLMGAMPDRAYQYQMLAQKLCVGREWVEFASFDPRMGSKMELVIVPYDVWHQPMMETLMVEEVMKFLSEIDDKIYNLLNQERFEGMWETYVERWIA